MPRLLVVPEHPLGLRPSDHEPFTVTPETGIPVPSVTVTVIDVCQLTPLADAVPAIAITRSVAGGVVVLVVDVVVIPTHEE